jgi:hypothetical protein
MQKTVGAFIITACLGMLDVAGAAYVIKLKNGNEYVTTRYWQEGSQILFDTYGGTFGIDKAFVGKIEKTDQVIRVATVADPAEKPQTNSQQSELESTKRTPGAETKAPAEKDENDSITKDVAKLKERSEGIRGMFPEDARALLKDISDYKNKILKDSRLFLDYGREFNDLQKMGAAVDEVIGK